MFAMLSRLSALTALGERFPTRERVVGSLKDPRRALYGAGRFLRTSYTDGVRALIAGQYNHRQARYIMAASLPALMGVAVVTLPLFIFPSPSHQAYFHFAEALSQDPAAITPTLLGVISTTLGFRVPLS